jgi:hypothetical protein
MTREELETRVALVYMTPRQRECIMQDIDLYVSDLQKENEEQKKLIEAYTSGNCPYCYNVGYISHQVGEYEYEQQQCGWCWTFEGSEFAVSERKRRIDELEGENKKAKGLIEDLLDVQNGCPLEKYRDLFEDTNKRAYEFLNLTSQGD